MSIFLEPVYLNEKMVLNCAAYLFEGVALESEDVEQKTIGSKGNLQLGVKFLQNLLSPISAEGELSRTSVKEIRAARRYTLGGLHMIVLDELQERKNHLLRIDPANDYPIVDESYVDIEAILRPIDFFTTIEILERLTPLVAQVLVNFGTRINQQVFTKKVVSDIPKYEEVTESILEQLESDYLKSNQLEMIMVDPNDPTHQFGIVDLDVADYEPSAVKARLTDGKFHVIGKVTKHVGDGESLSLLQRTFLSTVMELMSKVVNLNSEQASIIQYQQSIKEARNTITQVTQLEIDGPAYRVMAMSVCV